MKRADVSCKAGRDIIGVFATYWELVDAGKKQSLEADQGLVASDGFVVD